VSRTSIPDHLIHRSDEVERNGQRFDQLCIIAQEVALPVVRDALVRETVATGAEALGEEAKLALSELVGEAVEDGFDDPAVLDEIRRSIECAVPPPDEIECTTHAHDVAQVLMSAWLEILRKELTGKSPLVELSEQLLPTSSKLARWFVADKPPHLLVESLASLAMREEDTLAILGNLCSALFSVPRIIDLPFDLVLAGVTKMGVVATTRDTFERMAVEKPAPKPVKAPTPVPAFNFTPAGRYAVADLTAGLLSQGDYQTLHAKATRWI
jgi:hypothetical protein